MMQKAPFLHQQWAFWKIRPPHKRFGHGLSFKELCILFEKFIRILSPIYNYLNHSMYMWVYQPHADCQSWISVVEPIKPGLVQITKASDPPFGDPRSWGEDGVMYTNPYAIFLEHLGVSTNIQLDNWYTFICQVCNGWTLHRDYRS